MDEKKIKNELLDIRSRLDAVIENLDEKEIPRPRGVS